MKYNEFSATSEDKQRLHEAEVALLDGNLSALFAALGIKEKP